MSLQRKNVNSTYFNRINFREFREFCPFREKSKIGHSRKYISRNSAIFPIRESLSIIKLQLFSPIFLQIFDF